ncbi:serine hydrolase domain-containing protein [Actinoplanes sp. NPDC023714]|uniref:serine hydrolase domain-containing protein n=1 Tax=Actinoplanes sp. NPDC023714 TaxID=3154322 RepID=UPI0033FC75B9
MRTEILVKQGDEVVADDTSDVRYQIASVSKQFTAAAVLMLAEKGALALDDDLGRWIGGWPAITLHQLLTHTAGVGHWEDFPETDLSQGDGALLATFRDAPLKFAPGTRWYYSSPGYVLLAHVVQRASDTPYRAYLAERIFTPLGLSRTFAGNAPAGEPDLATGHDADGNAVDSWELDITGMGAGDLWSTAHDLMTWLDALRTDALLSEHSRSLMLSDHGHGYGYGTFVREVNGRPAWYHTGHNRGFKALAGSVPTVDRRIVVVSNTERTDPRTLERLF